MLMGKVGLVLVEGLVSVWCYVIIVILVLVVMVMLFDVISQIVLFSVIYGFYEILIIFVCCIECKCVLEEQNVDE